ncbi:hypothetical protein BHE74_00041270 [Ensete ventricosum]|nr:hypothetical protein BHE74_00041270 [Ensete ventricosum]
MDISGDRMRGEDTPARPFRDPHGSDSIGGRLRRRGDVFQGQAIDLKNHQWEEDVGGGATGDRAAPSAAMGRAPCCDKANVKKGPWSPEEDKQLKEYIEKHGTGGNWIALPQKAGLRRCGKSCRLRWLNYLRPNIKHGDFSDDEDRIICSLFASIGSSSSDGSSIQIGYGRDFNHGLYNGRENMGFESHLYGGLETEKLLIGGGGGGGCEASSIGYSFGEVKPTIACPTDACHGLYPDGRSGAATDTSFRNIASAMYHC